MKPNKLDQLTENAKKLADIHLILSEDAKNGRFEGVTDNNVFFKCTPGRNYAKVGIVITDNNCHTHHFFLAEPEGGSSGNIRFEYFFEGHFDMKDIPVRSFPKYLHRCLWYPLDDPAIEKSNRFILYVRQDKLYEDFCRYFNYFISKLKPIEWFYTKEPSINNDEELRSYLSDVLKRMKDRAATGRWPGINPDSFKVGIGHTSNPQATSIYVKYVVDDIFTLRVFLDAVFCSYKNDLELAYGAIFHLYHNCDLDKTQSDCISAKLTDFIDSFETWQGYEEVPGNTAHTLCCPYKNIDDSVDLFSLFLDNVTKKLSSIQFALPSTPLAYSDETETMRQQLESMLDVSAWIDSESERLNRRLNNGCWL